MRRPVDGTAAEREALTERAGGAAMQVHTGGQGDAPVAGGELRGSCAEEKHPLGCGSKRPRSGRASQSCQRTADREGAAGRRSIVVRADHTDADALHTHPKHHAHACPKPGRRCGSHSRYGSHRPSPLVNTIFRSTPVKPPELVAGVFPLAGAQNTTDFGPRHKKFTGNSRLPGRFRPAPGPTTCVTCSLLLLPATAPRCRS